MLILILNGYMKFKYMLKPEQMQNLLSDLVQKLLSILDSQNLVLYNLFDFSYSVGCKVVSHCVFVSMMTKDCGPFHMFIGHLDIIFYEVALKISCPFFLLGLLSLYWFVGGLYLII